MSDSCTTKTARVTIDSFDAYDANILKISSILEAGFCDMAVVMTISTLEVILTDLFKEYKNIWFVSKAGGHIDGICLENKLKIRKEIRHYLESVGIYDRFLQNYYIYQDQPDSDIKSIYDIFFPEKGKRELNKLNFQNLKGENGVMKAYKLFFNINLEEMLDSDKKKSIDKWNELNLLTEERHKIIHRGQNTSFSQERIKEILKSLLYMREKLAEELIGLYPAPDGFIPSATNQNTYLCSYSVPYSLI